MRRWWSGQSQQTVNLSASAFAGSNPARRTNIELCGLRPTSSWAAHRAAHQMASKKPSSFILVSLLNTYTETAVLRDAFLCVGFIVRPFFAATKLSSPFLILTDTLPPWSIPSPTIMEATGVRIFD